MFSCGSCPPACQVRATTGVTIKRKIAPALASAVRSFMEPRSNLWATSTRGIVATRMMVEMALISGVMPRFSRE